jgi:hypothetical protein
MFDVLMLGPEDLTTPSLFICSFMSRHGQTLQGEGHLLRNITENAGTAGYEYRKLNGRVILTTNWK